MDEWADSLCAAFLSAVEEGLLVSCWSSWTCSIFPASSLIHRRVTSNTWFSLYTEGLSVVVILVAEKLGLNEPKVKSEMRQKQESAGFGGRDRKSWCQQNWECSLGAPACPLGSLLPQEFLFAYTYTSGIVKGGNGHEHALAQEGSEPCSIEYGAGRSGSPFQRCVGLRPQTTFWNSGVVNMGGVC